MTSIPPFVGSGRLQEGGALATRKQDFLSHTSGGSLLHTANQILMNPPISILGGTTVQQTLQEVTTLAVSNGSGFISIGHIGNDGYIVDGYAIGVYNVGSVSTPTLQETFNAAFADPRLSSGGIVLVMAGEYVLSSPVIVPPGITIMGEGAATIIIGQMIEQSMFIVANATGALNLQNIGSPLTLSSGSNIDRTRFMNLTLADNINGVDIVGGTSGGASMSTVPMILVRNSANLEFQNVSFIGRINTTGGAISASIKTFAAVITTSSLGGYLGTTLTFNGCFFDGLQYAIDFNGILGDKDFLNMSDCKGKTYGNTNSPYNTTRYNSFIYATLCNFYIKDNIYTGAGTNTNTFLNIGPTGGTITDIRGVIAGNSGSPSNVDDEYLVKNDSGSAIPLITVNNNTWGNIIDSDSNYQVSLASGTCIIDPSDTTTVFEANTATSPCNIYLPQIDSSPGTIASGRHYIIKDSAGTSASRYITIHPSASGSDTIDNVAGTYVIRDRYAAVQFVSDGTSNWIVLPYNRKKYEGETITLDSSSSLSLTNFSTITTDTTSTANFGAPVSIASLTVGTSLTTGTTLGVGTDASITGALSVGSNATITGVCGIATPIVIGAALAVGGRVLLSGNISITNDVSSPIISQYDIATASTNGQSLTLQAQNATGTSSTGGTLYLTAGTGTNIGGSVIIGTGTGSTAGSVFVRNGGVTNTIFETNNITLEVPSVIFDAGVAVPTITQTTQTSDIATNNITISAQAPYASATTNKNAGNIHLSVPAPISGGARGQISFIDAGTQSLTIQGDNSSNIVINASIGSLSLSAFGTPFIKGTATTLGFFNTTPVAQASRVGQITSTSGGTVVTTIPSVGGSFIQSTLDSYFASIIAKINAIELVLSKAGGGIGVTM